jgi:hypothetical protein
MTLREVTSESQDVRDVDASLVPVMTQLIHEHLCMQMQRRQETIEKGANRQ